MTKPKNHRQQVKSSFIWSELGRLLSSTPRLSDTPLRYQAAFDQAGRTRDSLERAVAVIEEQKATRQISTAVADSETLFAEEKPVSPPAEKVEQPAPSRQKVLQPPFHPCRLCRDRLSYKPYYRRGRLPHAVIHHNAERYNWDELYADPMAAGYFKRILTGVLKLSEYDFHHIELTGCNFAPADGQAVPADAPQNCSPFVEDYLKSEGIKSVILTGEAAAALLGRETASEMTGRPVEDLFSAGELTLPGVILRSPAALAWLERRGRQAELKEVAWQITRSLQAFQQKWL